MSQQIDRQTENKQINLTERARKHKWKNHVKKI